MHRSIQALITMAGMALTGIAQAQVSVPATQARAIAQEAYIYGVPMLDAYRVMHAYSIAEGNPEYKGPFNTVLNIASVFTPEDTAFVTPNSDTPYTFMGLDLRAEPMVITLPAMDPKRYFVMQMFDMYSYNFDYLGTRTSGNGGGRFLVAGPRLERRDAEGITRCCAPRPNWSASSAARSCLTRGPGQREEDPGGLQGEPLSVYLGKPAAAAPLTDWIKPLKPQEQRTSLEFFNVLNFLLQFAPVHPARSALRERFGRSASCAGKPFDVASLSPEMQAALEAGVADGQQAIDAGAVRRAGKSTSCSARGSS